MIAPDDLQQRIHHITTLPPDEQETAFAALEHEQAATAPTPGRLPLEHPQAPPGRGAADVIGREAREFADRLETAE